MAKNEAGLKIKLSGIDEAIEKLKELRELLQEISVEIAADDESES